jgi:hypothetical protein
MRALAEGAALVRSEVALAGVDGERQASRIS